MRLFFSIALIVSFLFGYSQPGKIGIIASSIQTAPPATFDPSTLTNLKLWVKADDLVLSDGDPVGTWTDNSSASNTLTSSSTARPTYKTNIQNGKPIVRFDGSNDLMSKSSPSGMGGQSKMTICLVVKQASLAINNTYISYWNYNSSPGWAWQTDNASTDEELIVIADSPSDPGVNVQETTAANLTPAFYILTMVYDGTQIAGDRVKFYVNGSVVSQTSTSTLPSSLQANSTDLVVGSFPGLGRFYTGDFGEIILWNNADATEQTNVENYLNGRWNTH